MPKAPRSKKKEGFMKEITITTIMTPNLQAKRMLAIRYKRDQMRQAVNALDAEYNVLRDDLLTEMQKHSVLSLKTEDYTISRKKMKTVNVLDDGQAIRELQDAGYSPSITVKLNWRAMGQAIFKALKESDIPAAQVRITEYVAIKQAKDELKAKL
jgi:hypothetical protein